MKPTPEEITAEIKLLKELRPRIVPRSAFGDDNSASLDAAIEALEQDMDEDEVFDLKDRGDWSEGESVAALHTIQWRDGEEDEPYSSGLPLKKCQQSGDVQKAV